MDIFAPSVEQCSSLGIFTQTQVCGCNPCAIPLRREAALPLPLTPVDLSIPLPLTPA